MKVFRGARVASALCMATLGIAAISSTSNAGAANTKFKTVPIGMITSITGAYSVYGLPFEQGAAYAVSQINKTGFKVKGHKYKFKLTTENDNTDPATAVQKATGLIDNQHIVAMFGPIGAQGPAAEQITNAHHVLMFSSSSSVTATAGAPTNPLVFSTNGDPSQAGNFVFNAIKAFVPGATSVALLSPSEQTDAANVPLDIAAAAKDGLKFYNFSYPVGTTNLSSILTQLVADNPSVVIMSNDSQDVAVQGPQLIAAGLPKTTPELLYAGGISECATTATQNPCIADPLVGADLTSTSLSAASEKWVSGMEAFSKSSTLNPFVQASEWTYDFPYMLELAMQKAGTVTNTAAIAKALHEVSRVGLVGTIKYNAENGCEFPLAFTYITTTGQETTKSISSS